MAQVRIRTRTWPVFFIICWQHSFLKRGSRVFKIAVRVYYNVIIYCFIDRAIDYRAKLSYNYRNIWRPILFAYLHWNSRWIFTYILFIKKNCLREQLLNYTSTKYSDCIKCNSSDLKSVIISNFEIFFSILLHSEFLIKLDFSFIALFYHKVPLYFEVK